MLLSSQVENDSNDGHMQDADGAPILIPPPEIKSWADESARFVASVRPLYEKRIIAENAGMPEYSFLNVDDPYHAYYQHRLSELRAQNGVANDDGYLWLKEGRKSMTGNKKKITTSEWMTELRKRHERYLESLGAAISNTFVSPFTGEPIPAYQILQHLLEPKYKEQKERLFATIMEATSVPDDKIFSCVAWLAETRPHVFGTTEEEFANAVKAQIQSTTLGAAAAVVSPITSELIPAHELSQHMQDPKYKEQKERLFAKIREATLAKDDRISTTIACLARTRPDVFGTTEEEFSNAVKTEIESTKLPLDRLESSLSQNVSLDVQCSTLPGSQLSPLHQHPPTQEPEPKRQRLDDSFPVPEDQFLA